MDLMELNEWLTKTAFGTIVLGLVGSAFFAFLFWITKNFLAPWFLTSIKYLLKKIFDDHIERMHGELLEILENQNMQKSISFFAFHLMIIIICAAIIMLFSSTIDINRTRTVFQTIFLFTTACIPIYYLLLSFLRIAVVYKINFPDENKVVKIK